VVAVVLLLLLLLRLHLHEGELHSSGGVICGAAEAAGTQVCQREQWRFMMVPHRTF
jgi:hypothetical protein